MEKPFKTILNYLHLAVVIYLNHYTSLSLDLQKETKFHLIHDLFYQIFVQYQITQITPADPYSQYHVSLSYNDRNEFSYDTRRDDGCIELGMRLQIDVVKHCWTEILLPRLVLLYPNAFIMDTFANNIMR